MYNLAAKAVLYALHCDLSGSIMTLFLIAQSICKVMVARKRYYNDIAKREIDRLRVHKCPWYKGFSQFCAKMAYANNEPKIALS